MLQSSQACFKSSISPSGSNGTKKHAPSNPSQSRCNLSLSRNIKINSSEHLPMSQVLKVPHADIEKCKGKKGQEHKYYYAPKFSSLHQIEYTPKWLERD